jgi:UDP-glucuronate 4-epimerase
MRRILITGAAGFIGFHLAQSLVKLQDTVFGIDNFNSYYSVDLKHQRAQLLLKEGVAIDRVDLCDKKALKKVFEKFQPTHVVHLAAQAGVRYSLIEPDAYIQSNIVGFTNLLELMKNAPKVPLIYASSSSVYGNNTSIPFSESQSTDTPINLYGATKKANELMAYAYHSLYHIRMIGLRFFTVYGPWGRPDMAYYAFASKILNNQPITIYQGDHIQRDFTYIDDIVDGIVRSLDCPSSYEIFNLGNNKPIYLNTFIETLEEALGKKAIRNYQPKALGDMEVTYADISKSQKMLGFNPKTPLKVGLNSFANWFEQYNLHLAEQKTQ